MWDQEIGRIAALVWWVFVNTKQFDGNCLVNITINSLYIHLKIVYEVHQYEHRLALGVVGHAVTTSLLESKLHTSGTGCKGREDENVIKFAVTWSRLGAPKQPSLRAC